MDIEKRVKAFVGLGKFLEDFLSGRKNDANTVRYGQLDEVIEKCFIYNNWFTEGNVLKALKGISLLLQEKDLAEFAKQVKEPASPKTVAVIMAGNIPAV